VVTAGYLCLKDLRPRSLSHAEALEVTYVSQFILFVILPIPFSQTLASFKYHRTRSFRVSPCSRSLK
jgi:hypothetical protein